MKKLDPQDDESPPYKFRVRNFTLLLYLSAFGQRNSNIIKRGSYSSNFGSGIFEPADEQIAEDAEETNQ